MNHFTGFLNIYKEKGMSSMAACARVRRILDVQKAGHAGTLDPMAEGVLPVALGRACKSADDAAEGRKTYRAGMLLGVVTDTQDITGTVLAESKGPFPSEERIREVLQSFVGEYDQLTPMYSARQVDGKRLYELAREGLTVERKSKKVDILDICVEKIDLPHVVFLVTCTKGTYVRTLCHDAGEILGCGACMESLVRTAVGKFDISDALSFRDVEELRDKGLIDKTLRVITPTAVAIGKFDGAHLGHRKLFRELRKAAEKHHLRSLVLILNVPGKSISDRRRKKEQILSMGIDYCIEYELDKDLMNMSAEDFLTNVLIGRLAMRFLVASKDVAFGKDRTGNAQFLLENAAKYGFTFKLIDKLRSEKDGREISSTMVREAIGSGDMEEAGRLLGEPFSVCGKAYCGGTHIAKLSIPEDRQMPPFGTYLTETVVLEEEPKQIRNDMTAPKNKEAACFAGMSVLMEEPDGSVTLENTLPADAGDTAGKTLEVRFLRMK